MTWRGIEGRVDDPGALVTGFRPVPVAAEGAGRQGKDWFPATWSRPATGSTTVRCRVPCGLTDLEKIVASGAADLESVRAGLVGARLP